MRVAGRVLFPHRRPTAEFAVTSSLLVRAAMARPSPPLDGLMRAAFAQEVRLRNGFDSADARATETLDLVGAASRWADAAPLPERGPIDNPLEGVTAATHQARRSAEDVLRRHVQLMTAMVNTARVLNDSFYVWGRSEDVKLRAICRQAELAGQVERRRFINQFQ